MAFTERMFACPGFLSNGFYRERMLLCEGKGPYPPLPCLQEEEEAEAEVAGSILSCAGRQGNREAAAPSISPKARSSWASSTYMLCSYMLSQHLHQYLLLLLLLLMLIVSVRGFRIPSSRTPIHIHLLPFCASALTVDRVRTAEWPMPSSSSSSHA